MVVLDF